MAGLGPRGVVAKDTPLDAFLQELSRYHGAIECDPAVARLPVSGVFQLDDTRKVLALLRQILPVDAAGGALVVGRAGDAGSGTRTSAGTGAGLNKQKMPPRCACGYAPPGAFVSGAARQQKI